MSKLFAGKIKKSFINLGISLYQSGQVVARSDKAKIKLLKDLIAPYEKATNNTVRFVCQSSINDFIIMLQLYYKKNGTPDSPNSSET